MRERSTVGEGQAASKFHKATKDAFLIQHQTTPTRFRHGQLPKLDDLVFTNREDIVLDISKIGALGKSDHATLLVDLALKKTPEQKIERFKYNKADYTQIRKYLGEIDWKKELAAKTVNQSWNIFTTKIIEAKQKFVPKSKPGGNQKKWIDGETITVVRKKHQQYRRWLRTQNGQDYTEYVKARNKAKKYCRKAKIKMEATVAKQAKDNPKSFWSYVRSKTNTRTGIPELKKENGSTATTDMEKAQVLNNFFQSVFTCEPDGDLPPPPRFDLGESLADIIITREEVDRLLKNLKTNKATGPDGIPPLLLAETADQLATPIFIIFQKFLEEGRVPNDWKRAHITPIFKKGSRQSPNNYRPVSLTCILSKVMETLIRGHIMKHLLRNNLICQQQHGFTPGRSCTTQLLDTLDYWTEILDQGGSVDAIYMDFRKAFDSVPHRRLMLKIQAHGIGGKTHQWIKDFLSNRTQQVNVNGEISTEAAVSSGIPQGSVLGPLLFVIYINDLPQHVINNVRIFADDTKLFAQSDQEETRHSLQEDLNTLHKWSMDWLLRFHPDKCCVMHLGHNNVGHTYSMKESNTDGEEVWKQLKNTETEKDLGVIIDNKLSFRNHVELAMAKANRTLGVIRRSFDYLSDRIFVQLYKALVRPILEYGHSVWHPSLKTLKKEIESVQRRATKLIGSIKDKTYPERLRLLQLPSLEYRRQRGDMIDTYKYLTGIYTTSRPNLELHVGRETRGHKLKLAKHRSRLKLRSSYFSQRIVAMWNSLPDTVTEADNINVFKNRLDAHWANLPVLYDPECIK